MLRADVLAWYETKEAATYRKFMAQKRAMIRALGKYNTLLTDDDAALLLSMYDNALAPFKVKRDLDLARCGDTRLPKPIKRPTREPQVIVTAFDHYAVYEAA